MTIKMICAVTTGGFIGKDGDLIYKLKKDLVNFKKLTTNQLVLMGRSTWESLPRKPLPQRVNVVLTSKLSYKVPPGVFLAHSKEQILNHHLETGKNTEDKDLWIIGGNKLYCEFLDYAEEVYLTRVKDNITIGDVTFPLAEMEELFYLVKNEAEYHEEDGIEFTFEKWIRKDIKDLS